ncbi:HNH endonuclease [Thermoleophilia bacterium SCSIO 60948]|nr:HNH endonuclease [Thermoleophilia bacterium SCSIO 60948]
MSLKVEPEVGIRGALRPSLSLASAAIATAPGTRGRVLVLNASYEPINVCSVRRATVLLLKERAELLEHAAGALRAESMEIERPCVIRLVRYVRIPRDVHRRKITRKAVLARDSYTCQYCGVEGGGLTVDHVIPRSRGGGSAWDNIVASCAPCNRKKGNRLPREIAMHPRTKPKPPGPTVFIRIASPKVPSAWETYLPVERLAA